MRIRPKINISFWSWEKEGAKTDKREEKRKEEEEEEEEKRKEERRKRKEKITGMELLNLSMEL